MVFTYLFSPLVVPAWILTHGIATFIVALCGETLVAVASHLSVSLFKSYISRSGW